MNTFMGIEHEPKDELLILSDKLHLTLTAMGFDTFNPDAEELHKIYKEKLIEPNQTLIALESEKKMTKAVVEQIASTLRQFNSPLYEIISTMIEGGNIGYIIIKPKIN